MAVVVERAKSQGDEVVTSMADKYGHVSGSWLCILFLFGAFGGGDVFLFTFSVCLRSDM
jgi:Flp pilus assembly protein protease CpaA